MAMLWVGLCQPYYLWTGGKILSHGGDTATDHADVWIGVSAKNNFAVLVTTNINEAEWNWKI